MDRNATSLLVYLALIRVALRKESVDRNMYRMNCHLTDEVALRKESVDRNIIIFVRRCLYWVALRKESVDRNLSVVSDSV